MFSTIQDLLVQILTDYKVLEYFMTTKQFIRRQARWTEYLFQFDFQISYRPGIQNVKTDLLTRQQKKDEVSRVKLDPHLNQTLFKPENLFNEVKQDYDLLLIEEDLRSLSEIVEKVNRESSQFNEIRQTL